MRIPRIYEPASLQVGQTLALSEDGANHIGRVLRMQPGQQLELFNGDGHQYTATITSTLTLEDGSTVTNSIQVTFNRF